MENTPDARAVEMTSAFLPMNSASPAMLHMRAYCSHTASGQFTGACKRIPPLGRSPGFFQTRPMEAGRSRSLGKHERSLQGGRGVIFPALPEPSECVRPIGRYGIPLATTTSFAVSELMPKPLHSKRVNSVCWPSASSSCWCRNWLPPGGVSVLIRYQRRPRASLSMDRAIMDRLSSYRQRMSLS